VQEVERGAWDLAVGSNTAFMKHCCKKKRHRAGRNFEVVVADGGQTKARTMMQENSTQTRVRVPWTIGLDGPEPTCFATPRAVSGSLHSALRVIQICLLVRSIPRTWLSGLFGANHKHHQLCKIIYCHTVFSTPRACCSLSSLSPAPTGQGTPAAASPD
jgi:hypothetical protein